MIYNKGLEVLARSANTVAINRSLEPPFCLEWTVGGGRQTCLLRGDPTRLDALERALENKT